LKSWNETLNQKSVYPIYFKQYVAVYITQCKNTSILYSFNGWKCLICSLLVSLGESDPGKAQSLVLPAYESIIFEFGTEILHTDGSINRKKLGDIVFSDNSKLNILNQITHGIVAEKISSQLRELRNENKKLVVVEAIVPIEQGFLDLVDTVWVVLVSEPIRIERIIKRNDITHSEAKQRVRSQMSDAMYKSIADKVIYNNGNIAELEEKVWEALKNEDYSISK